MGNCTGGCNCSDKKEARALWEHKQAMQNTQKQPLSKPKPKPIQNMPAQSTILESNLSTISNLSTHPHAPYITYYHHSTQDSNSSTMSNQINAKTMELLSTYIEDDISSFGDQQNEPQLIYNDHDLVALKESNSRIHRLSSAKNPYELEQFLHEQYNQNDDEGEDIEDDNLSDSVQGSESESELSPQEMDEIHRRKSDLIAKEENKPNLLRDGTKATWNYHAIETLRGDMAKELLSLQDINSNKDKRKSKSNYKIMVSQGYGNGTDDEEDNEHDGTPFANLFRVKSSDKWEAEEMDQTKEDMERAMLDLMKASKLNGGNNNLMSPSHDDDLMNSIASSIMSIPTIPTVINNNDIGDDQQNSVNVTWYD